MTQMRTGSCTWFAAIPAPAASRIVSTMSSMSRWIGGLASSSRVTSRARWRSTGCPMVAIFLSAIAPASPLLRQDDRPRRFVAEEHPRCGRPAAHLTHLEAVLVEDLAELVQAVGPERVLDLPRAPVVEHHRALDAHPARDEVDDHLVHAHAPVTLEPGKRRRLADEKIAVDDVEQEEPPRLERATDPIDDLRVLLLLEVTEARVPAEDAVELLVERHVAHVALHEVELDAAVLGVVAGARK